MEHLVSWAIPIVVTCAVVAFARWRQRLALARGAGDLPTRPYFTIPDDVASPGSRNARLVLTTWDLVKRNFAEAILKSANIRFAVTEATAELGDVVRGGPVYQMFVLNEAQAAEARQILREQLGSE